jgi:hypothetical protein
MVCWQNNFIGWQGMGPPGGGGSTQQALSLLLGSPGAGLRQNGFFRGGFLWLGQEQCGGTRTYLCGHLQPGVAIRAGNFLARRSFIKDQGMGTVGAR